jgi:hypothetical protein
MNRDFSTVKDLSEIEKEMDWSYSSPYKGTISTIDITKFDIELTNVLTQ